MILENIYNSVLKPKFNRGGLWTYGEVIEHISPFFKDCKSVLDIGSGVGKFCLLSAALNKDTNFIGVEIFKEYYNEAVRIKEHLDIKNANFINDDFRSLNLDVYDGFYIFNPFPMNIYGEDRMKCEIAFRKGLEDRRVGTKLVIFNPFCETPNGYKLVVSKLISSHCNFYIKES